MKYFMPAQILSRLRNPKCVACGKELQVNDEVHTKRSGNNLRIRCIECARRYHLID